MLRPRLFYSGQKYFVSGSGNTANMNSLVSGQSKRDRSGSLLPEIKFVLLSNSDGKSYSAEPG